MWLGAVCVAAPLLLILLQWQWYEWSRREPEPLPDPEAEADPPAMVKPHIAIQECHSDKGQRLTDACGVELAAPKDACASGQERCYISYGIWGHKMYAEGVEQNIKFARRWYPGWRVRTYVDHSISDEGARAAAVPAAPVASAGLCLRDEGGLRILPSTTTQPLPSLPHRFVGRSGHWTALILDSERSLGCSLGITKTRRKSTKTVRILG